VIDRGWPVLHESGTLVRFTRAAADLLLKSEQLRSRSSSLERPTDIYFHAMGLLYGGVPMPNRGLLERARMFEERAERATDPVSRQHYREMAAHYRALSIEQTATREPETAH